jgi:hypothetical protein
MRPLTISAAIALLALYTPLSACGSDAGENPTSGSVTGSSTSSGSTSSGSASSGSASSGSGGNSNGSDITDAIFSNRSGSCSDYVGSYVSSVRDLHNGVDFKGQVEISAANGRCTLSSNSIPNHDFGSNGAKFANPAAEVQETLSFTQTPSTATMLTELSLRTDNAVMLNGVKLDLLAAACYGVGQEPLGKEKIGCGEDGTPWRYDPMFSGNSFGTDGHNAHTQPDGAYHYHGSPEALFDLTGNTASGVVGFAADGFPIYGPFIDDGGSIRRVVSGYTLKAGKRVSQNGEGAFPGGDYDGTFRDDYAFTDAGDLDACNGMTRDGQYGYYVTNSFPWVLGCFTGTPDASFNKAGGGGP